MGVSDFLKHSDSERRYFLLLIQKDKAGTQKLRDFLSNELRNLKNTRQEIRDKIHVHGDLNNEDKAIY